MDKKVIEDLCSAFDIDKLVLFFRKLNSKFTPSDEDFSEWDDENFTEISKLGRIKFSEVEALSLFSLKSTFGLAEKSSKKRQFDKAKKILKDCMTDAGIFVFYDESGNFRMSLIFQEFSGTKAEFSNYKRYTYYVSPELTNKTFIIQMQSADFSSLEGIKEAFSVEKVTKQFYDEIAGWYFRALKKIKFTKEILAEKNGKEKFVIRLITRLIFIWFMKEKKIIKPNLFDKDHIANILNTLADDDSSYYNAILQNLFFATLNTPIEKRKFRYKISGYKNASYMDHSVYRYENYFNNKDDIESLFKDIPFLNGGLFECLDRKGKDENGQNVEIRLDGFSDKDVGLKVPNWLFFYDETYSQRGILNILSQYNFTIDENETDDYEIALDPELLGRVFENLLARTNPETSETVRKTTGSYYTPRQIVDYMVENSIKEYLKTRLDDTPELEVFLEELFDQSKDTFECMDENIKSKIIQSLAEIKIADPAVGSGAFPMGVLNKLVFLINKLDPNDEMWSQIHLEHIENKNLPENVKAKLMNDILKRVKEKNYDYIKKLFLIQNSIYGVDIQDIAIQISKLRFFLSLLIEENIDSTRANMGIEPLPNLDFKLMAGNSLVEYLPQLDKNTFHDEKKKMIDDLEEKKEEYFVENDAKRKDKLKSEIFDLMKRIVLFENNVKIDEIEKQISSLKDNLRLFHGDDADFETQDIKKYKIRLDKLKKENEALEFNSDAHFEWHIIFSEVFEDGGFDIIIGNPPYIQLQKNAGKLAIALSKLGYETFARTGDIYVIFYEKGWQLLKDGGHLTFITSNKWMRAAYGEKLRRFLSNKANPKLLIDLAGVKVFKSATVDTNILAFQKGVNKHKCYAVTFGGDYRNENFKEYVNTKGFLTDLFKTGAPWIISNPVESKLKEKIENMGKPLKDWDINIYRGVLTGCNEAFIIDGQTKDRLIAEDPKSAEIIKPLLRGRDIKRYHADFANLWLIFIPWHFPLHDKNLSGASKEAEKEFQKQYPFIYKHLLKYKEKLEKRNQAETGKRYEWYALQRCANTYNQEFEKEKIIFREMVQESSFAYDNKEVFCLDTSRLITGQDLKFLLAILNSKLFFSSIKIFYAGGGLGSKGVRMKHTFFENFCVPKIDYKSKNNIENIIEEILQKKSKKSHNTLTTDLEHEIDRMIYDLYDLSEDEIKIIEKDL